MSEELKAQIEKEIHQYPVVVYMKGEKEMPLCGFSNQVVQIFKALETPFEVKNVLDNIDEYRLALKTISDWHTIPQVFVGGEFIGGCDVTMELYNQGELQKMVETAVSA